MDTIPAIVKAAACGDADEIAAQVRAGADVNVSECGYNALRTAARAKAHSAIRALVELGADVNAESHTGNVALHYLCDRVSAKDFASIELLAAKTAPQYHQTAYDWCSDMRGRNIIRSFGHVTRTAAPEGGFGGAGDKEDVRIQMPPTDETVRQLWRALASLIGTVKDDYIRGEIVVRYCEIAGTNTAWSDDLVDDLLAATIAGMFAERISAEELPAEVPEQLFDEYWSLYPRILARMQI